MDSGVQDTCFGIIKFLGGQGWRWGAGVRSCYAALPDLEHTTLLVQLQFVVRITGVLHGSQLTIAQPKLKEFEK